MKWRTISAINVRSTQRDWILAVALRTLYWNQKSNNNITIAHIYSNYIVCRSSAKKQKFLSLLCSKAVVKIFVVREKRCNKEFRSSSSFVVTAYITQSLTIPHCTNHKSNSSKAKAEEEWRKSDAIRWLRNSTSE